MEDFLAYQILGVTVEKILKTLILAAVCLLVVKTFGRLFKKMLGRSKVEKSLHTFLYSMVQVVLYFLAVMVIATSLGINVTSLVALFSVVSLAVSMALQGLFGNIASGVILLTVKPFKGGDYIVADGVEGTVMSINLIYTHLKTPDNKLIYVPNSDIATAKITNNTAMETRRVDLVFSASYDAPIEEVKKALAQAVGRTQKTLTDPEPMIRVQEYGSSAISYVVRVWAAASDYWDVYFDLTENVKRSFDENKIEMTYDHLNVHIQ